MTNPEDKIFSYTNKFKSNKIKKLKVSTDSRIKIGSSNKGKIRSPETRKKYSLAKIGNTYATFGKGKKLSENHKQKISESRVGEKHWMYGKHLDNKWKNNISLGNIGKK